MPEGRILGQKVLDGEGPPGAGRGHGLRCAVVPGGQRVRCAGGQGRSGAEPDRGHPRHASERGRRRSAARPIASPAASLRRDRSPTRATSPAGTAKSSPCPRNHGHRHLFEADGVTFAETISPVFGSKAALTVSPGLSWSIRMGVPVCDWKFASGETCTSTVTLWF